MANRSTADIRGADLVVSIVCILLLPSGAYATQSQAAPVIGQTYEIIESYTTTTRASDGSSGSSRGQETVRERVIAVRDSGVELEYDLPPQTTPVERGRQWQLPARVFRTASGPMRLLNTAELESRLASWLKAAGWDRSICGRTIFTWDAFKIECDPQSAATKLAALDLGSGEVREGASYSDPLALAGGVLTRKAAKLTVELPVDPAAVQRARAEADVGTGEITNEPVTLEIAFAKEAKKRISGTITVNFDTDEEGRPYKRTKETTLRTVRPDGVTETRTATEVVERRRIAS